MELDIERVREEYRTLRAKYYADSETMTKSEELLCRGESYMIPRIAKKGADLTDPVLYRYAAAQVNRGIRALSGRGQKKARRILHRYFLEARKLLVDPR